MKSIICPAKYNQQSTDSTLRVDSYETKTESVNAAGTKPVIVGIYEQEYTWLSNNQTGTMRGRYFAEWVEQPDGT